MEKQSKSRDSHAHSVLRVAHRSIAMLNDRKTLRAITRTVSNWPLFLADYYLQVIKKDFIEYELKNGLRFYARPASTDAYVLVEIHVKNMYSRLGFEIEEKDSVVDIGAHVGMFTVLAAKKAVGGAVYSFEPVPGNFEILKRNIRVNNITNAVPTRCAVADEIGVRDIYLNESNTGGHSFYGNNGRESKVTVTTKTLESILTENGIAHLDFLKIDCEGAEYEILYSTGRDVLTKISKIVLEYHSSEIPGHNPEALAGFLRENGFSAEIIPAQGDTVGMIYAARRA